MVVDAAVVIAEILLDLHAMRSQYREATGDLDQSMKFLKETFTFELDGYNGNNIQYVIATIRQSRRSGENAGDGTSSWWTGTVPPEFDPSATVRWGDGVFDLPETTEDLHQSPTGYRFATAPEGWETTTEGWTRTEDQRERENSGRGSDSFPAEGVASIFRNETSAEPEVVASLSYEVYPNGGESTFWIDRTMLRRDLPLPAEVASTTTTTTVTGSWNETADYYYRRYSYADRLLKIAHIFHFASIGILGIFVIQVSMKVAGMGCEFFKKKLEIFDAVIVFTSFALDVVFMEGVTGTQGEEAIALLIIFLLWRILRVINGIMVTTKKRQEFRIQLQKRARRRAEKKIEYLEDDKNWKDREIANLKRLCAEKGAVEEEVTACKPRRRTIFQKMDTSMGLSSIASLSLGLSMSMTGAGAGTIMMRSLAMRPAIPHHGRGGPFHGHPAAHRTFSADNPGTSGQPHQGSSSTTTNPHPTTSGGRRSEDNSCCLVQLDEEEEEGVDGGSSMDILTVHSDPKTDEEAVSRSPSPAESLPSIQQTLSSAISLMTTCTDGQTPSGQTPSGQQRLEESVAARFRRLLLDHRTNDDRMSSRRTWTSQEQLHTIRHHPATMDRNPLRRFGSQLSPGLAAAIPNPGVVKAVAAPRDDLPAKRLAEQSCRKQRSFGVPTSGLFPSNYHPPTMDSQQRSYPAGNGDPQLPARTTQFQVTSPLNSTDKRCNNNIPAPTTYGATTDVVHRLHRIRSTEAAFVDDDSSATNRNAVRPQSFRARSSKADISPHGGRYVPPVGNEPNVTDFGARSNMKSAAPDERSCVTISGTVVAESVSVERQAYPGNQQPCRMKVDGLGAAVANGSAPALILGVQRKTTTSAPGDEKRASATY